jgi:hypothetical protein
MKRLVLVAVKDESYFICILSLNNKKNISFISYFHYKPQDFYSAKGLRSNVAGSQWGDA